jgi:hypothetical protein
MSQTAYGQSDAVARELAAALNEASDLGAFCLRLAAEVRYARLTALGSPDDPDAPRIPSIGEPASVQIISAGDQGDRTSLGGTYDDTYGVHVLLQQHVGAAAETQVPLLLQLRSEVLEFLLNSTMAPAAAVHPFKNAHVLTYKQPQGEMLYDLDRLESLNAFYSDTILTYKAAGLRRNTNR